MEHVFIDIIRENSVYTHNAVVSRDTFVGDFDALLRGEEVPIEYDEHDNPIEWAVMSEEQ